MLLKHGQPTSFSFFLMKSSFLAFVALAVSGFAEAAAYSRTANLYGQSFLDAFEWVAIADPTHGRTNYVTKSTAKSQGLYSVSGNTVTLRADYNTVLEPSGPGRNSFRLQSKDQYSTHVAIFDIGHIPEGCGTWPAEVGADWPNHGEIDIVEGVNNVGPNQSTLHTRAGCTMQSFREMTGTSTGDNCDVYATENCGCGVRFKDTNSFGIDFNNIGGGWYAIERSATDISIYFWERDSSSVPSEVKQPGDTVRPSTWGRPMAFFESTNCDFASHLGHMSIIINLAFCGDLAGDLYSSDQCPGNCVDYVNNNPSAFSNAYFEFNALNIYQ
ncbi:glycoside hydrolase family 16 protein [Tylopilus felleus]